MHAFKHLLTALLVCTLCIIPYTASAADTNADYRGYVWRIDMAAGNAAELPHNFRTAGSPFQTRTDAAKFGVDPNYIPSREGLDTLVHQDVVKAAKNPMRINPSLTSP